MSETLALLQAAENYAIIAGNIVSTIASEAAYADNRPGASYGPHWRREDHLQAMADHMDGKRHVEFDMSEWNALRDMATSFHLESHDRRDAGHFRLHFSDPTDGAWTNSRLDVFFHPDGSIMGAHSQRYRLHVRSTAKQTPGFILGQIYGLFSAGRAAELAERQRRLDSTNASRAKRDLEPYPTWTHMEHHHDVKAQEAALRVAECVSA